MSAECLFPAVHRTHSITMGQQFLQSPMFTCYIGHKKTILRAEVLCPIWIKSLEEKTPGFTMERVSIINNFRSLSAALCRSDTVKLGNMQNSFSAKKTTQREVDLFFSFPSLTFLLHILSEISFVFLILFFRLFAF